jgi:hypothetical protein
MLRWKSVPEVAVVQMAPKAVQKELLSWKTPDQWMVSRFPQEL